MGTLLWGVVLKENGLETNHVPGSLKKDTPKYELTCFCVFIGSSIRLLSSPPKVIGPPIKRGHISQAPTRGSTWILVDTTPKFKPFQPRHLIPRKRKQHTQQERLGVVWGFEPLLAVFVSSGPHLKKKIKKKTEENKEKKKRKQKRKIKE